MGWQVGEEHNGGRGGMKSVSKLKSEHDGIFQVGRGESHLQLRGKTRQGQRLNNASLYPETRFCGSLAHCLLPSMYFGVF